MKRLGEIVKVAAGQAAPKEFSDSGLPFIRAGHLEKLLSGSDLRTLPKVSEAVAKRSGLKSIPEGTIIFAKSGMSATKNRIFITNRRAYFVSHLAAIPPVEGVSNEYLARYLSWYNPSKLILDSAYPSIRLEDINNLKIALPPFKTQKRIVQILDNAQALKQKTEQLLNEYDALVQAIFLDMFGLKRRLENNWKEVTIKDLAANKKGAMRTGPFGSDLLHSEFVEDGIPVLGIDNAVLNTFQWKERRFITKEKYEALKRYTVFPNDIIITIMGTIGKVAVVPEDIGIAINTKHLAAISLNYEVANPKFLAYSLYSDPYIIWQINSRGRGAIMTGLNLTIIKNLKLFLPPISLQNQFAEKIALIEKQKELVRQELKESEDLFNCLLQKAFKGELL